jgi:K+-sensing histidine kinase KdpD
VLLAVAVLVPIVVALLLTPWRDRLAAADNALILVVVIVAVATTGYRWAAAVCAVVSALSFDFFLTRPYGSFRISRTSDLVTELLLLVVGLAVGDLAARGRNHRVAAWQGRRHLEVLHNLTGMAAGGRDPDEVVRAAGQELNRLLGLRSCTFRRSETGLVARVEPDGEVRIGAVAWATWDLGLPHRGVDLPVRSAGRVLGHFVLLPVPGTRVPRQSLEVAVDIADQVGAALAGRDRTADV